MSKPCDSCPFNDGFTTSATEAQNLACLPSAVEILEYKDKQDRNWHCHSYQAKICEGLREERDVKTGTSFLMDDWYKQ